MGARIPFGCAGDTPQLGQQRDRLERQSDQGCLGGSEPVTKVPIPVIEVGRYRVGGPAAEEVAHTLDGRPPTGPKDAIGRLPDAYSAGLRFTGWFCGVM